MNKTVIRYQGRYYALYYSDLYRYCVITRNDEKFFEAWGKGAESYLQMIKDKGEKYTVEYIVRTAFKECRE